MKRQPKTTQQAIDEFNAAWRGLMGAIKEQILKLFGYGKND